MYHGLYALESIVVNVNVLKCLAYAGNHTHQVLDVAHFLDLAYLLQEIVVVKLALAHLFLETLGLLGIKILLGTLHE